MEVTEEDFSIAVRNGTMVEGPVPAVLTSVADHQELTLQFCVYHGEYSHDVYMYMYLIVDTSRNILL